jgi:Carboxypeptidase regulatory-like domain
MSAFILVFAHRYFAVTDDEGRFRLENVPPGTYNLMAWNETALTESRRIVLPDSGGEVEANFVLGRR